MKAKRITMVTVALLAISSVASANWTAKQVFDPIKNETHCMLESVKHTIDDGYQDTEVLLRVNEKALFVVTRSNINASKGDIGFQVDRREFVKMDRVYLDQTVVFETEIAKIIQQFKEGLRAQFTLRFWPTYPDTGSKSVTFSLIGFTKAYGSLPDC